MIGRVLVEPFVFLMMIGAAGRLALVVVASIRRGLRGGAGHEEREGGGG